MPERNTIRVSIRDTGRALGRVGFGTKTAEPSILVAVSPFSFSFSWSQLVS